MPTRFVWLTPKGPGHPDDPGLEPGSQVCIGERQAADGRAYRSAQVVSPSEVAEVAALNGLDNERSWAVCRDNAQRAVEGGLDAFERDEGLERA